MNVCEKNGFTPLEILSSFKYLRKEFDYQFKEITAYYTSPTSQQTSMYAFK